MAKAGSEVGTSNPTERKRGMMLPTRKDAFLTAAKPVNPKQNGTGKADRPVTPSTARSSCSHDDFGDEQFIGCYLDWLHLDPDTNSMLDDKWHRLVHYKRRMRSNMVPMFQLLGNENAGLFIEDRAQITAAVCAPCEVEVRFDTWLDNISYFRCCQGQSNAYTEGGKTQRVRMQWESLWCFPVFNDVPFNIYLLSRCTSVFFLMVYPFPICSWFLSECTF